MTEKKNIIAIATYEDNGHVGLYEFRDFETFFAWAMDQARVGIRVTALEIDGIARVLYSDDDAELTDQDFHRPTNAADPTPASELQAGDDEIP